MPAFLKPFEGRIYSVLRAIAGLMFVQHGLQKTIGFFGGPHPDIPVPVVWISGSIELVGGALVAVGLFTRWAAFLCSGLMAAAYFMAHAPQHFFPIMNKGELAILYCWIFLFIAASGSGSWSLDKLMGRS